MNHVLVDFILHSSVKHHVAHHKVLVVNQQCLTTRDTNVPISFEFCQASLLKLSESLVKNLSNTGL